MSQWFPVRPYLLAMLVFICSCQINRPSPPKLSLSTLSSILSRNLPLLSLSLLSSSSSSMPCPFGNYLFDVNEPFLVNRSTDQKPSVRIFHNYKHVRSGRSHDEYISFNDKEDFRKKRGVDQDCSAGFCCLKSLYFDFHEHGMDYIIKPSGFNINFCEGECNMEIQTNDRDMLILQDGMNHPESPFRRRLSCCIPIKWSSVEIIESRDGTELNRTLENVKVVECGCAI
uniref:TGF-beta family profile domain-containing protein n=1 Tax=Setaria digitata TaxID=48799 RepID=A0A915PFL1_9BILA